MSRPTVAGLEAGIGRWASLSAVLAALGLRLGASGLPQRGAALGERLAAARRRRGWSVAQAAERAGLSSPTVRSIERAGRGRLETLSTLTEAVGGTLRATSATAAGTAFVSPGGAAFTSGRDEHWTPPAVIDGILWAMGGERFTLDPCSPGADLAPTQVVPADRYLTKDDDGLAFSWGGAGAVVYVNPPYSRIAAWVAKCRAEAAAGTQVVALVPARTETRWWRDHVAGVANVVFMPGRLRFGGPAGAAASGAPFPSALLAWRWPPEAVGRLLEAFPGAWLAPADAAIDVGFSARKAA